MNYIISRRFLLYNQMSYTSKPVVLSVQEWDTSAVKYMAPKTNEKGGKSINLISKQTNRTLHFSTPLMMTWGVSDFVDEKTGESDGKFSISLNFPNEEYRNPTTDLFLKKIKDFENQILDDAVKNSELWWGEEMSREVCKHTFFPFLKYSKNKETKKVDLSKPPSIRAKVPYYNGKWGTEIYNTKQSLLFPCENANVTPLDFIPKFSNVACVLQCGGLWIGGKGWGLTWKMIQCIVKPHEIVSVYGRCQIQLSPEDCETIDNQKIPEDVAELEEPELVSVKSAPAPTSTLVEDSDDEAPPVEEPVKEPVPAPVKKVVKKAVVPPPAPVEEPVVEESAVEEVAPATEPVVKKKIVKKKV